MKEKIKQAELDIIGHTDAVSILTEEIQELQERVKNKSTVESDISVINKMINLHTLNHGNALSSIEFYEQNHTCPTCSQEIDQEFKQDEINSL